MENAGTPEVLVRIGFHVYGRGELQSQLGLLYFSGVAALGMLETLI